MKKGLSALIFSTVILITFSIFIEKNSVTSLSKLKHGNQKNTKKTINVNGQKYDGPEKFAYYMSAIRAGQEDLKAPLKYPQYSPFYKSTELEKVKKVSKYRARASTATFIERGPGNVPGRTRSILLDPDDATQNTWYAASVSGGIWKTTNSGNSWQEIAPTLENLAIVTLAMSEANSSVIYAGTGEGFIFNGTAILNGNGIYKSTDKGATWNLLSSTNNNDFVNVSRIIVDPTNENILLASTSGRKRIGGGFEGAGAGAILKSNDGGATWTKTFETDIPVQQIVAAPSNFSIQYAATALGHGVYKSSDGGVTWNYKSLGLNLNGRIELAVSNTNPNKVYGSAQGGTSGSNSDLYVTSNGGDSWDFVNVQYNGNPLAFLGSQGWYDNTIMVHPFDDDKVYIGGIGLFEVAVDFTIPDGVQTTYDINTDQVNTFLDLTSFGASAGNGRLEVGSAANNINVEIRFGSSKSQKAHRFLVPEGAGAGVNASNYSYQDYVDVPFEVWDITNNRQLMASFRDQQRDGTFDLIGFNTTGDPSTHSREYFYINNSDYDPVNPNPNITIGGGHEYELMYFTWPFLADGAFWTPETYDNSNLTISSISINNLSSTLDIVSDSYGNYDGTNRFTQGNVQGVHPDQHWLSPIITDSGNELFKILNGNDGGIYLSNESTNPGVNDGDWTLSGIGYNTSQFYGADKVTGSERYFGGTQDNGTWLTQTTDIASSTSNYIFVIGGDGFEVVNHYTDPLKMIGGSQFNGFYATEDNWETSYNAQNGLKGNGPFISRLSNAYQDPDVLFTVESTGVFKSIDFGKNWKEISIIDGWGFWSGTDVEVSKANPRFVWAGGRMDDNGNLFISTDGGESFNSLPNFDNLGLITGIYSHPTLDSTAFVVFSVASQPKILKTDDLGQNWMDISGYSTNSTSTGFPDVATFALQAMPFDKNVLWASTEIGLFESLDGGQSWNIVDQFPSVTIWDFKIKDGQVIIATHGRGIWTADIPELDGFVAPEVILPPEITSVGTSFLNYNIEVNLDLLSRYDSTKLLLDGINVLDIDENSEPINNKYLLSLIGPGFYSVQAIGFAEGIEYPSNIEEVELDELITPILTYYTDFENSQMDQDFDLIGWNIQTETGTGFTRALNTVHPYQNSSNYIAGLKIPITVSESDPVITFNEIVLVEEGEDGSVFGDFEFWDFVILEGSTNGVDWQPIIDGYDSRANGAWNSFITNPNSSLYRNRTINLSNTFSAGEIIKLRFRLFSDPFVTSWGWSIDELSIQINNSDIDADGDGFIESMDCDDQNPDVNSAANEIIYNGIDDDCNPATLDDDLDQDGFPLAQDCDDNDPNVNPNITEIPYNGIDDDCDPSTLDDDLDQDGFLIIDDCDDNNADINPNAVEIENNDIDENCDGLNVVTGLNNNNTLEIKAYPVPTSNILNITINQELTGLVEISITDLKGKVLTRKSIFNTASQVTSLDLSALPSGVFLLRLSNTDSTIIRRVFKK